MEITKIPIVDFMKYSLESAYQNGFSWIMCLLARDADAENTYKEIKKYWESLHDLTGEDILFVFAGKCIDENKSNSLLRKEVESYKALTNPSIRFVSDNIPEIPSYFFPKYDKKMSKINEVNITHTRSIRELRDYFNLSEKDIPSLILIPAHNLASENIIVLNLSKENLYNMIKKIIENIQNPLVELKSVLNQYKVVEQKIKDNNNMSISLRTGENVRTRFKIAKDYLYNFIRNSEDYELRKKLQDSVTKRSVDNWRDYDHQTRKYLNQYLDLLIQYPSIKEEYLRNEEQKFAREEEKIVLDIQMSECSKRIKELYSEISNKVNNTTNKKTSILKASFQNERRFKIAISYPRTHLELVTNIADKLKNIFGEDKILFDKYHMSEFSRPNLDTYLQKLYHNESDLIVVFICNEYQEKVWCGIEWKAIRDLMNQKKEDDRIMLVKCGDGDIDGLYYSIDGYLDSNQFSIDEISNMIYKRYALIDCKK